MDELITRIGAYGVWRNGESILLALKARGPYKGAWDLPGGGIERGEHPLEALKREFVEETGAVVTSASLVGADSAECQYVRNDSVLEHLFHIWLVYIVQAVPEAFPLDLGQDTSDVRWFEVSSLSKLDLSPVALWASLNVL